MNKRGRESRCNAISEGGVISEVCGVGEGFEEEV